MGQDVARPLNCDCLFSASIVCLAARSAAKRLNTDKSRVTDGLSLECPPRLDGVRVLVVDDDSDTRQMLKAVLSESHADVITAASAAEAIKEIERRKPDVLVSDLGMPEQDGYELIKEVRETESADNTARIPALALTAYAKAEDRVRALAGGYQVHLSKPVEPAEFVLVVANLAGRDRVATLTRETGQPKISFRPSQQTTAGALRTLSEMFG